MKQVIIISILIVGLLGTQSFAQMQKGMMGSQNHQQTGEESSQYLPCPQMMGGGMMGYGMSHGMMGHPGMMMGPNMMGYGGTEANKKFLDDTAGLRRELHIKKFDYSEALRNPGTKAETIGKFIKEIQELQKKIYEKAKGGK